MLNTKIRKAVWTFWALITCMGFIFTPGLGDYTEYGQTYAADSKTRQEIGQLTGHKAMAVSIAIGLTMEGPVASARIAPVRFEANGVVPPEDALIRSKDFHLASVAIEENKMQATDARKRAIRGLLLYTDPYFRSIYYKFSAGYTIESSKDVIIHKVWTKRIHRERPRALLYLVPAGEISPDLLQNGSYIQLLKHAAEHGVFASKGKKLDRSVKDYYVFAFFMDQLNVDAYVELVISGAQTQDSISFQEDGWHVAYARANFPIDGYPTATFRAYFTQKSKDQSGRRIKILAMESNSDISKNHTTLVEQIQTLLSQHGYDPGPADGQLNSRTTAAIKKFQQDNKMKIDGHPSQFLRDYIKTVFPNSIVSKKPEVPPVSPIKVLKVQHWMSTLGYYHGPIDGKMNQETRNAMARFNQDQDRRKEQRTRSTAATPLAVAKKTTGGTQRVITGGTMDTLAIKSKFRSKMWPNRIKQPQKPKVSKGYSIFPEPMMFVVPADALTSKKLPGSYAKLLQFVSERAVPLRGATMQKREYVIFVFLEDKVSPTAKFEVKISNSEKGKEGYARGAKYLYLNGRHVAYLSGRMTLFSKNAKSMFYVKAVFTPGKEVGYLSRTPNRVGLFSSDGT